MTDAIALPGIGCTYSLPVTLALAERLEAAAPVLQTAARLVAQEITLPEMLAVLRACYGFAGCSMPPAQLDAHLRGQSPALLLAEILCAVLGPVSAMGAITETAGTRRVDITSLRRFFLGVLGWTPATVMRDASLRDLCDAYLGHAAWHGLTPATPPGKEFLAAMLQQFPDRKGQ